MNAEIKLDMVLLLTLSSITKLVALGVAPLAAELNADTIIESEKVLTANIVEAITFNKLSKVLNSILGKVSGGKNKLESFAAKANKIAQNTDKIVETHKRLLGCLKYSNPRYNIKPLNKYRLTSGLILTKFYEYKKIKFCSIVG